MNSILMMHRADNREPIHDLSLTWESLTELNAGNLRANRLIHAAIFRRRIGLQVPSVLLTHTTIGPKNNERFPASRPTGFRSLAFQPQQIGEPQSQQRCSDLQEIPARAA